MFLRTKKGVSCFIIYKALPFGFFIAGLSLLKLVTYVVEKSPGLCVLTYVVDAREVKAAACKLVVVTFCEKYRRLTVA